MICKHCGTEIENDSNFCKGCGKSVMASDEREIVNETGEKIKSAIKEKGDEIVSIILNDIGDSFGKAVVKKNKKVTNALLKKMHLKKKTPIDIVKKKFKR